MLISARCSGLRLPGERLVLTTDKGFAVLALVTVVDEFGEPLACAKCGTAVRAKFHSFGADALCRCDKFCHVTDIMPTLGEAIGRWRRWASKYTASTAGQTADKQEQLASRLDAVISNLQSGAVSTEKK